MVVSSLINEKYHLYFLIIKLMMCVVEFFNALICLLQVEQVNVEECGDGPSILALRSLCFLSDSQVLFPT